MNSKYFTTEEKDGKTWIINHMACHIDGEPFKYEQINKSEADLICELLNDLEEKSITLHDIMAIVHNIRYNNWELKDLLDYIYSGVSIDEIYARYDDLSKMIKEMI